MSIGKSSGDTIADIKDMVAKYQSIKQSETEASDHTEGETTEDTWTQEYSERFYDSSRMEPARQYATKEPTPSHSTLQIVILNIVGFILGWLTLCYGFPLIMKGLAYLISIPVLGDLIRFGVEPAYIVFPYSAWIASAIAGIVCYKVCAPTKTNKRIGMIILGVAGVIQYTNTTISLFRHNGFEFVFIVFAVSALIAVSVYFISGFGKE